MSGNQQAETADTQGKESRSKEAHGVQGSQLLSPGLALRTAEPAALTAEISLSLTLLVLAANWVTVPKGPPVILTCSPSKALDNQLQQVGRCGLLLTPCTLLSTGSLATCWHLHSN